MECLKTEYQVFPSIFSTSQQKFLIRYTDDTNSTLALATSIVEKKGLDAQHAALSYATFWKQISPLRGYPGSAQQVMNMVLADPSQFRKAATVSFSE